MATLAGVLTGRSSLRGFTSGRAVVPVIALVLLAIVGVVLVPSIGAGAAPAPAVAAQVNVSQLICSILQQIVAALPPFVAQFLQGLLGAFGCSSP